MNFILINTFMNILATRSRVSISPNVTIVEPQNKKRSLLSPTISIIPPQATILKPQNLEQQKQAPKGEPDLINLESTQSSPIASLKKSETKSSCDSIDQLDNNEKKMLYSPGKQFSIGNIRVVSLK